MINIADFSRYPTGRDDGDGAFNGTRFRADFLLPAMREAFETGSKVIVSLDDVNSLGSSFLEEAFGGLIRKEHLPKEKVKSTLEVITVRASFQRHVDAIWRYIDSAR
jgi:hypothetical protein